MPTLQFKGKNIIWNHHLSIPYHTLDEVEKLNYQPEKADGNFIIEGDNLLALKALLPQYAGKVKCSYIDPPYNTGNEGWAYNDNVNSPMLKEWLGKEVGKDDLTRHDKWLCMMVPRLKLLRELLADDGAIFISIDENEQHHLRQIMNEIFGDENHVVSLIWAGRSGKGGTTKSVEYNHEYVEVFVKDILKLDVKPVVNIVEHGNYLDSQGNYKREQLRQWGQGDKRQDRPFMFFPIIAPDGNEVYPKRADGSDGRWRFGEDSVRKMINSDDLDFVLIDGSWTIYRKIRVGKVNISANDSLLLYQGSASTGTIEIKRIFGDKVFDTVKPVSLIKHLIELATYNKKDSIILDSFAGSGTTMHAVMDLNKEDGGNRKCILIQMTEATAAEPEKNICKDITRERVKRAIDKFGYDSGFQYFKVGIPIDAETLLSGNLPTYRQFAEYVYYLCTGESLKNKSAVNEKTYFVGEKGNSVIYLVYKHNFDELTSMALNLSLAEKITAKNPKKKVIVYAPACFLEEDYMNEKNIDYVGIPYNLFKREEQGGRS